MSKVQPKPWTYTREFESPETYFSEKQVVVKSFQQLIKAIDQLTTEFSGQLFWRGQSFSGWGVHSTLFRKLAERNSQELFGPSVVLDYDKQNNFPKEEDLIQAEQTMLKIAREEWRLESKSGLEILSLIHQNGGPSRFINVTLDPLVAIWFAVSDEGLAKYSGRLFAFAKDGPGNLKENSFISLDDDWARATPIWHSWQDNAVRAQNDWGNGELRRFWVPPADERNLLLHKTLYMIDGVPISDQTTQSSFRKENSYKPNDNWKMSDLLASGSIYMKYVRVGQENKSVKRNMASTYTFEIIPEAKLEIKKGLERMFQYKFSTLFPDLRGLSDWLNKLDFMEKK